MADEEKKYPQATYQGEYDQKVRDLYGQMEARTVPNVTSEYDSKVNDLYNQIANRNPFSFDGNDELYQQYVDRYTQGGKQAMRDTMGQAAALTGGYGNSYAQAVGQQQYDKYMEGLNDKLTDMYQMQLAAYNSEGDRLNNLLGLTSGLADRDYNRGMEAYQLEGDRLNGLLGTAATLSDSDYNRLFQEAQMRQQMGDDSLMRALIGMPVQTGGGGGYYGGGSGNSLYDQYLALKSDSSVSAGEINDWLVGNAGGLANEGHAVSNLAVAEGQGGRVSSKSGYDPNGKYHDYN